MNILEQHNNEYKEKIEAYGQKIIEVLNKFAEQNRQLSEEDQWPSSVPMLALMHVMRVVMEEVNKEIPVEVAMANAGEALDVFERMITHSLHPLLVEDFLKNAMTMKNKKQQYDA